MRKLKIISKFMTSQPEKQTIAIHVWPNISRSKGNQTMKLGPLIEYNVKGGREISSKLFLFLKKPYMK